MRRTTEGQNNVVITDRMWARLLSSTNLSSFTIVKAVSEDKRQEEANGLDDIRKVIRGNSVVTVDVLQIQF
ncbi:ATP-dependent 6-phosphofructokinase 7 [Glycine max]|nr:ATP-dependent 6-phosphofructokinase 7 [Glycine max]